ncbi:MAG: Gfo/Idh/MocA family oxidoreductase [Aquificae bacterium]|nr:Gfo/Idh/MocA family oxidoreductase [Aquificota bacterium]
MRILLVGLGNMGTKYLSKVTQLGFEPVLYDTDKSKLSSLPFPSCEEPEEADANLAIVAVDPKHHVPIAKRLLGRGMRVLLEKPPALSSAEFEEISSHPLLEVSEIELYSEAVKGFPSVKPRRIVAQRYGRGRGYVSPLWDLAWHDLYILQYLFGDVSVESMRREGELWELEGRAGGVPFVLRVAWNHPSPSRLWRVETQDGEIIMDFQREEIRTPEGVRARLFGDKLTEMILDFVEGKRREGSARRALNNLKILESLGALRGD